MSPWITSAPAVESDIGPLTMIHNGQPISLDSEVGALAVLHGALQSAIASVDDATTVELAYLRALSAITER